MADRTWNPLDGRLFDELSATTAVVLSILIGRCPNEHGVWDLPRAYLERFIAALQSECAGIIPAEIVESALLDAEEAGVIRRYPDRSVWLVKKFSRSPWHQVDRNHDAAVSNNKQHHQAVLADFLARYRPAVVPMQVPPDVPLQFDTSGTGVARSESETDIYSKPEDVKKQSFTEPRKGVAPRNSSIGGEDSELPSPTPLAASLTEVEIRIWQVLSQIKGFAARSGSEKTIAYLRQNLFTEFPDVDWLDLVKSYAAGKQTKPITEKSLPLTELRNWGKRAQQWAQKRRDMPPTPTERTTRRVEL